MQEIRPLVMSNALSPIYGGSAFSEVVLCSTLKKYLAVTILCRKGNLDYSFARSHGLNDVIEYSPEDIFRAYFNRKHWLHDILRAVSICHMNGHWRWEDHFLARLCKRYRIPYVIQPRGMFVINDRRPIVKRIFNFLLGNYTVRNAARIIALSEFEARQFEGYPLSPEKIVVLPNGITLPGDVRPCRDLGIRQTKDSQKYFFYLGRLEPRKNLLFLIDVFRIYVQRGGESSLLIMGPSQGGYREKLESKIRKLSLSSRVQLLEPTYDERRWQWAARSCAVIYPTIDEAFGRVPFESLLAGALVIVPDKSGSAEYLRSLVPHGIYKSQDVEDLCRVLTLMDGMQEAERSILLRRAKAWVENELDWDRICSRVIDVYSECLGCLSPRKARISHDGTAQANPLSKS